jgi:hypothetical protein
MSDEMKAALEAAVAVYDAPTRWIDPRKQTAEIVTAFLRALPGEFGCCKYVGDAIEIAGCRDMQELAVAVEASAHD